MSDYERVAAAIQFIQQQYPAQPSLEEVASSVGLSPYHFHRLFRRWVGTSPKRFLAHVTVEAAKQLLDDSQSVLDAAYEVGLSGPGRLHDHFVTLEAVTPGEHKRRGEQLNIDYGVHDSPFGRVLLAATERGLCRLAFVGDQPFEPEVEALAQAWPRATLTRSERATGSYAKRIFEPAANGGVEIPLFVRGTNFQIQVWKALLRIPTGSLTTYTEVARAIGRPTAVRAVGGAVGANPIAFLIPCHRVVRKAGDTGGYRWGTLRKQALIAWEAARRPERLSLPGA